MAISETIMMWKEEDLEAGKRTRSQLIEKKIIRPHKYARKLPWTVGMEEFSYRCCIIAIKTG